MSIRVIMYYAVFLILASCGSNKNIVKQEQKKKAKKSNFVLLEEEIVEIENILSQSPQQELIKKVKEKTVKAAQTKAVKEVKKPTTNTSVLEYIQKYASAAVTEMNIHKIPASITLAQGILESGSANGDLAKKSNNHFGIKCHTGWTGQRVYHDDDKAKECFRKYKYVETSYGDHSEFLTKRKRYAFLFNYGTKDYKNWAKGLKKAGYATDVNYPNKLISIIERYKLYELDSVVTTPIKKEENKVVKIKKQLAKTGSFYEVKKGDTLYSISRAAGISVDQLKNLNNLKDNIIPVGKRLTIK